MKWRARGHLAIVVGMLALVACGPAPAGAARASSGADDATPAAPLRAYPTETPTITPVPPAPDCAASQLATQLIVAGPATGNLTGSILIWNSSPTACSMSGAVGFAGLDATGAPIAAVQMNRPRTLASVYLPPDAPTPVRGVEPAAGAYLDMLVIGAYRDDPTDSATNGMCAAVNEVTPAAFLLTIGPVALRIPNDDPQPNLWGNHALYGCHGAILGEGIGLSQ